MRSHSRAAGRRRLQSARLAETANAAYDNFGSYIAGDVKSGPPLQTKTSLLRALNIQEVLNNVTAARHFWILHLPSDKQAPDERATSLVQVNPIILREARIIELVLQIKTAVPIDDVAKMPARNTLSAAFDV